MLNLWPRAFIALLYLYINGARALNNITIDSTNITRIDYSGNWATLTPNIYDYGGTHQWSSDPSANAKFNFID